MLRRHIGRCLGRGRHLHIVGSRTRRRRHRALAREHFQICFDGPTQARPVVALEAFERVDVGHQRIALGTEVQHFGFEASPLRVSLAPRVALGLVEHRAGLALGVVKNLTRLRLRFGDRFVGGALREQQRPVEHVFGLARLAGVRGRGLDLGLSGSELAFQRFDTRGRPFEQVVDVVLVIPAEAFTNIDVAEFPRRYIHTGHRSDRTTSESRLIDKSDNFSRFNTPARVRCTAGSSGRKRRDRTLLSAGSLDAAERAQAR